MSYIRLHNMKTQSVFEMPISFENIENNHNIENELSIRIKSVFVFRGQNYDSFYIIGSMVNFDDNLIKIKYFSTKHDIFNHRGVFRIIIKPDTETTDTYKNEPISCFAVEKMFPDYSNDSSANVQSCEENTKNMEYPKKPTTFKAKQFCSEPKSPSYHPYMNKNNIIRRS